MTVEYEGIEMGILGVVAVRRLSDGATIPLDPENADYQEIVRLGIEITPPQD